MKMRLIGNENEFDRLMPELLKKRYLFSSYRSPQYGSNPKYADDPKLLCYLEITVEDLIRLLNPDPEVIVDIEAEVVREPIKNTPASASHVKALPAARRQLGDGTTISFTPKK